MRILKKWAREFEQVDNEKLATDLINDIVLATSTI
jgi:hypothetical protein